MPDIENEVSPLKVEFPLGVVTETGNGTLKLEYNKYYITGINKSFNNTQAFLDRTVANNLMKYVSYRTGVQEASIPLSSVPRKWKSTYQCSLCQISSLFKKNKEKSW